MTDNAVKSYACPGCGGELIYRAGTDEMICPHCGRTAKIKAVAALGDFSGEAAVIKLGREPEGKCPNCGAAVPVETHTAATFCTYCKAPILVEANLHDAFCPEKLIPFAFDRAEAQKKFKNWTGTGKLTPSSFKSKATMDKVTGMYVPYWLYSYTVNTAVKADCYNETVSTAGSTESVRKDHYEVTTAITAAYDYVPQDASEKIDDVKASAVEPYDYAALEDFSGPFLSGFFADTYEAASEQYEAVVKKQIEDDMLRAAEEKLNEKYDHVELKESESEFLDPKIVFALLPMWILNFEYLGKTYPLYMNGQTGKICGELPTSKLRVLLVFLLAFAVFFGLAFLIFGRLL